MKVFLKKLLVITLIVLTIFNFLLSPPANADVGEVVDSVGSFLSGVTDGILGALTWILIRLPIFIVVLAVMGIISGAANIFGQVDYYGNPADADVGMVGPDDIFFNKLLLTDANIFNINDQMPEAIIQVRTSIALWYYVMRVIAITILLGILVFIAIKMAISSISSQKALYKEMLINWTSSIALVFALHYVIVGICYLNSIFISILGTIYTGVDIDGAIGDLMETAMLDTFSDSTSALIVLVMLVTQTLAFLIYYVKRMLTISFLVIISPLITITYSIDKLGDGKAQALNTWMKEFFFTVIIQPFHCIIYMAFVSISFSLLQADGANIMAGILSILCIKFVWDAEKMIKNIFGVKVSSTLGDAVASAAVAGAVVSKGLNSASKIGSGAKKLSQTFKLPKREGYHFLDNFRDSSWGQKFNLKSSEEKNLERAQKKQEKADRKLEKYANKQKKKGDTRPIKEIKQQRDEQLKAKKEEKQEKKSERKEKRQQRISNFHKFLDSDNGMIFKRVVSSSAGVAAAIMGGAAAYGASEKTSLFEAGVAGYGSYNGIKGMTMRLMNRKTDDYGKNMEKDENTLCQIRNEENTHDKEKIANDGIAASRMDKEGDFSASEMKDKRKNARKSIQKLLTKRDGYDKGDDNVEIDEIMTSLENGIFLGNLNWNELAQKYNLNPDDLRNENEGAVKDFAEAKVLKQMAQSNKEIDELAGQDGYYKIALEAWAGSKAFENALNSNNSQPSQQSQQQPSQQQSQQQSSQPTPINPSDIYNGLDSDEHDYASQALEMNETYNEIQNVNNNTIEQVIDNQTNASVLEKNNELTSQKIQEKKSNAEKSVQKLLSDRDSENKKLDDKEISNIMDEVTKGVENNNLNIKQIANNFNLDADKVRDAIKAYAEALIFRQMAKINNDLNTKKGSNDKFKTTLETMKQNNNSNSNQNNNQNRNQNGNQNNNSNNKKYSKEEYKKSWESLRNNIQKELDYIENDIQRGLSSDQDKLLKELNGLLDVLPLGTDKKKELSDIMDPKSFYSKPNRIEKLDNGNKIEIRTIEDVVKRLIRDAMKSNRQLSKEEILNEIAKKQNKNSFDEFSEKEKTTIEKFTNEVQKKIVKEKVVSLLEIKKIDVEDPVE